ncbi:MAG: hypothetical protein IPH78_05735 [Bacteroidetes bacterium]|nr:hypothetical protein [Bacteroidota bacterium]
MAAVDATTGAVLPWNPNPNSQVMVLAADGGLVYTGGYFSSIGGQSRNFLAAIDASGNATAWNPNPDSYPLTLATSGGKVYVSGGFSNIGGQIRNQLAEIDAAGNATAWNPNPDGGVNDIDIDNNTLFVSGGFNNIAGSPRKSLAAFNLSTGNLNAWNPNPNSNNERLSAANGKVYVVGSFSEIGGQTRNGFAELDGTSGIISTFNTLNGSNILDIDANASYIVAGGANNIYVDGNQVPFLAGFTQAAPPPACTGTPAPGNTIASLTTVCANDNLSFSIQNAAVLLNASGITYQWQANTGSGFADINGAISNYYATSQLVTTTYRCKVTCTASSSVAYSTPVTVTQNALQDCYCTPIDYYGQYAYISNVTIGTINNTTTFESNYYGDYTAQVTNAGIGLPQTISIGNPYGAYVYAFIDYNQDGDFFDAGEMVVANTGSGPFTFTIPNTALAGNTRLRVAMSAYSNSYPCYTLNGETEDYTLHLILPPACSGSPVPGNTLASLTAACASDNISLSLQNIIAFSGITYQWQANSGSGYADISGATSATHTASQSVATTYRCRVTCTNSGSVVYSTPVTVTQTVCYCTPTDYYGQYTYIGNVSIGSINNSTGYENNYYGNYTSQLTYALPGQSQNITIDIPYDAYIYVYIDYNQDGDFTDIDEIAVHNYGVGTQSFSFTVPVTATAGPCRMRIATSYYDNGGDACYTYYGESEDYTLFINANPIYVWTGAISTAWNNAGNWTPSGIPSGTDDVIIPDLTNDPAIGFIPGSVNDINIADGVTISVNSGIALYINGNITAGSGTGSTIAGAGGVVELNGSDPQQINGKLSTRTLRINNSSMGGVDVLGTLDITNGLIMIDGDVNANSGTVTLKSGPTTAAYLDNFSNVTAGTYSGDLTVERYIANTADGYRNISSPVNTTVADLADDMSISGADGVNCWYSYSPYPNVQVYEEAANNSLSTPSGNYYTGWISKTGTGNAMPAMKGFALRTYAGAPFTIDLTGTPYTGSKSADLTNTPSATPAQDGWNFIGNPFASPISWTNTEANNPGATTGSYYVFNTTGEYTGNWGAWNGVSGINGASDMIASMQGFFVKTMDPYNYVEATNASRVASATIPFFKAYSVQPNEIRLSLHDATNSDEIVAYTDGAATWNEDMGQDAVKIPAGSTVYMSYKQLGKEYAINVIDEITRNHQKCPLSIVGWDTGTLHLQAT